MYYRHVPYPRTLHYSIPSPSNSLPISSRLLPRIPPLNYGEQDVVPESLHELGLNDVPLQCYRRQRLLRATGQAPQNLVLPPARSVPAQSCTDQSRRLGQFRGDLSVITWNAQAFFAADPLKHAAKEKYLLSLLGRADVVIITEAHGTQSGNRAWRPPHGCKAWWSAGPTTGHAGVGVVAKDVFLQKFDRTPTWSVIWPGRAARLSLSGPEGSVDILAVYSHTGSQVTEHDLFGVADTVRPSCVSFPALRAHLRCRLANAIAPKGSVLTVLGGDFNWVTAEGDRISLSTATPSSRNDSNEENHFKNIVARPHGLHEMFQMEPTHASATSRSRLDRIYCNQHVVEQLDRHIKVVALEWKPQLSHHRAVLFARRLPHAVSSDERPVCVQSIQHDDFPRLVALNFNAKVNANPEASDVQKLLLLKAAVKEVGQTLARDDRSAAPAVDLEDRLGTTMKFIRAFEGGHLNEISSCIARYPKLKELISNPYAIDGNTTVKLRAIKDHAIDLAREHALDELSLAHRDLENGDTIKAQHRRQKSTRLLYRLAPGRSGAVDAIRSPSGELCTNTEGMATLLRNHWSTTFLARGIDAAKLHVWLEEDRQARPQEHSTPFPDAAFRIQRQHIRNAIQHSNNSAPGPDGIPFAVWRRLGPLAVDVLFGAFQAAIARDGPATFADSYPDFNASLLFFIPKKADGVTEDGKLFYDASAVRPLNVTNTDNRLLASSVRLLIEPFVAERVSSIQRGFIAGRSMLANLIDIDESMAVNAVQNDQSAALLFDFTAAFPSIEHELLHSLFRSLGWPEWLLRFIHILYQQNKCFMIVGGARFTGFEITRGIRQGCPLSPLLFAVASDLLLRRLQRTIYSACTRAYADYLAIVLPTSLPLLNYLEDLFTDYEYISGLALNIQKTVYIPLHPYEEDELRRQIHNVAPSWGAISIKRSAKYLGYMIGPGREDSSWTDPVKKFLDRARTWGEINPGMLMNLLAYKVFIASVLTFIAQLDVPPETIGNMESKACVALFPGPRSWITAGCLKHLQALGFPSQLLDIQSNAIAAKIRVYKFENLAHGGLQVATRVAQLRAIVDLPVNAVRRARLLPWLDKLFLFNLQKAVEGYRNLACRQTVPLDNEAVVTDARTRFQATVRASIASSPAPAFVHLRRRLDRWKIPTLPGHRPNRAIKAFQILRTDVPPRVLAAVYRGLFNGFITARRFQQQGSCVFGCNNADDGIEHYAACRRYHHICMTHLRVGRPPYADCLGDFLLISPYVESLPAHVRENHAADRRLLIVMRAIAMYCLHNTLLSIRHGMAPKADAGDVFGQYVREAVKGHSKAGQAVQRCRTRPATVLSSCS